MHSACRWASKQKKDKIKDGKPTSSSDKATPAEGTPATSARKPTSEEKILSEFAKPPPLPPPVVGPISGPSKALEECGGSKKAAQQLHASELMRNWSDNAISELYRADDLIWIQSAGSNAPVWSSASQPSQHSQPPSTTMNSWNWRAHGTRVRF